MSKHDWGVETVFPAYAGMSRLHLLTRHPLGRFPRLRGDEPTAQPAPARRPEFSPPTRG